MYTSLSLSLYIYIYTHTLSASALRREGSVEPSAVLAVPLPGGVASVTPGLR